MKRGLNIAELCYISPLLLIYEVFRPAACSKMSTERAAMTSVFISVSWSCWPLEQSMTCIRKWIMMRIGRLTALWHLRRIWMHF